MPTWYPLVSYTPPVVSGAGSFGGVGGGWQDQTSSWRTNNLGGGTSDNAIQVLESTAHNVLRRSSSSEQTVNGKVQIRYQAGWNGEALYLMVRGSGGASDNAPNNVLYIVRGGYFYVSGGTTSGTITGTGFTPAAGAWYDLEATWVTTGGSTVVTEKHTNVTNHITDAFGSGSVLTNNVYTANASIPTNTGWVGFYSFNTTAGVATNVTIFNLFSDQPSGATGLTWSPASSTVAAGGSSVSFTVTANGTTAGSTTVNLSDGGAGGHFTVGGSTVTSFSLAAGAPPTPISVTYVSGSSGGAVTLTATDNAGTLTAGTASLTVTGGATSTALSWAPSTQTNAGGAAPGGAFTVATNGTLAASLTVNLSDGGAGGTFTSGGSTVTTLTFGAGNTSASVTYTPSSAGTKTLTASASGLTSGTATVTASAGTALALSPSNTTVNIGGTTTAITVSTTGLYANATVTLSDGGAGGSFSPGTSVTLTPTVLSQTFTYTPAAVGTPTITATATGLTAATCTVTCNSQPTGFLDPASSSVVLSPYNWETGMGGNAARTCNPGAYARCYVSNCSYVDVTFGACVSNATIVYRVDYGPWSSAVSAPNVGTVRVTIPDTGNHTVEVMLYFTSAAAGRWSGSNVITLAGFQMSAGGVAQPAVVGKKRALIYGDSITSGDVSEYGPLDSFAFFIGQALLRAGGWEYGMKGASYSGYAVIVAAGNGGQPAAITVGDDTNSSWNKALGTGTTGARITSGTPNTAAERFVQQPDIIIDAWGTNDSAVAQGTLQPIITALHSQLRVAAPNAAIINMVPFGGYARASIVAAMASIPNPRTALVDLQTDAEITGTWNGSGAGGVHPYLMGHANVAPLLLARALNLYVPFSVARPFGSVS